MCVYIHVYLCVYVFKEQWCLLWEDFMSADFGGWNLFSLSVD